MARGERRKGGVGVRIKESGENREGKEVIGRRMKSRGREGKGRRVRKRRWEGGRGECRTKLQIG